MALTTSNPEITEPKTTGQVTVRQVIHTRRTRIFGVVKLTMFSVEMAVGFPGETNEKLRPVGVGLGGYRREKKFH